MKVLYTRVSTDSQSLDRQLVDESQFQLVIKEKGVSGSVPFWERPNTSELHQLLKEGKVSEFHTHSIDRLGRNLKNILQTIEDFHSFGVPIHITSQGLITMDKETGKMNPTTTLILSVMGSVSEMERNLIRERIKHSLSVKKMRGELLGRRKGSVESVEKFLSKPKTKKVRKLLEKGYSVRQISSFIGVGTQFVMKVRKVV
jgi:DNA invertase Pin-like site-specific DNA recombinase